MQAERTTSPGRLDGFGRSLSSCGEDMVSHSCLVQNLVLNKSLAFMLSLGGTYAIGYSSFLADMYKFGLALEFLNHRIED